MNNLKLNSVGVYGELKDLPNPNGFVFRVKRPVIELLIESVVEMDADVLDRSGFESALNDTPVIVCLPQAEDPDFPFILKAVTYEDYLNRLEQARQ